MTAFFVVVGAVIAWLLVDWGLGWWRSRRPEAVDPWHGQGPGSTIHSDGFADTLPPHEAADAKIAPASSTGSAGASARAPS